ncbi:hypothetical protein GCM10028857_17880 [Salinarchaeum chitinilyticum]
MRLADDERGRVPFALVGVLLLLGSVAIATVSFDGGRVDRDAALAGDRAESVAETALRDATRDAGATAAANPVVAPADTEFGSLLDGDRPYRSYLELLIAIQFREALRGDGQRVADARATVNLTPITDADSAEAAMDRVSVEATSRGIVAVEVTGVPIEITRDGHLVDTRYRTITANVTTPTLTLHDRTTTFQERLNGETLEPGSLSRGLTGGLYGLGWTRGYGQYSGLPIDDVIANRHVELVTNLAVLDAQRSTFGNSNQQAEQGLAAATAQVVANETIGVQAGGFLDAALPGPNQDDPTFGDVASPPTRTTVVGVNGTADAALADLIDEGSTAEGGVVPHDAERPWAYPLETIVRTGISLEAELETTKSVGERELHEQALSTAGDWMRVETIGTESVEAVDVGPGDGSLPSETYGWSRTLTERRTVVIEETATAKYRNVVNDSVRYGQVTFRRPVDVGIALEHQPLDREWIPSALAPDTDGWRYESLAEKAETALVDDAGGVDAIARSVATDESIARSSVVSPDDLADESDTVYEHLATLRDELRDVQTTTELAMLTTDADPSAELRGKLKAEGDSYRNVPTTYDDLDQRAAVAARNVYFERVLQRLKARSLGMDGTQSAIQDKVDQLSTLPSVGLNTLLETGLNYARPEPATLDTEAPAPALDLTVDADPGYLDLDEVNGTAVPPPTDENGSYYPLAAKTTTVDSLPTDDMASKFAGIAVNLFDSPTKRVPLAMAARSLDGANAIPGSAAGSTGFVAKREQLREKIRNGVDAVDEAAVEALRSETGLSEDDAAGIVDAATVQFGGPAERALAYDDGSALTAIGEKAAHHEDVSNVTADRAEMVVRERVTARLGDDAAQVKLSVVESVTDRAKTIAEDAIATKTEAAADSVKQRLADRFGRAPVIGMRGIPLVPFPGWWAATGNVWRVEVAGTYAGFSVRAAQGGPSGGGHVSYVRDGQPVAVDVTGDGSPELLGNASRISFEASTTVAVVVPPSGGGVGNGNTGFKQTSDGWE